jgi:hypothetical protein
MADNKPSIHAATGRVLWRLAPILLGIAAYFSLGYIEETKTSYDRERAAPILLADKTSLSGKTTFEIGVDDIEKRLSPETWKSIGKYVGNLRYQSFKNENELGDALNEQILAEKAISEKKYQYRREALFVSNVTERLPLFNDRGKVESDIERLVGDQVNNLEKARDAKRLYPNCFEQTPATQRRPANTALGNGNKDAQQLELCKQLQKWEAVMTKINDTDTKYQNELTRISKELGKLDETAQGKIRAIYTELKPELLAIKNDQPQRNANTQLSFKQDSNFLKSFNYQSVLDENHGIHVIYQVARLTFVIVLVFGMISVVLAILRLFPSFASSSGALTEQARTFLVRQGGSSPDIARAAIVSVAALGIGAAAIVTSGAVSGRPPVALSMTASTSQTTQNNQQRDNPPRPEDGVLLSPPIPYPVPYPSPVTVQSFNYIPPLDHGAITELSKSVEGLRGDTNGLQTQINGINDDISKTIRPSIAQVRETDIPALQSETMTLSGYVDPLRTEVAQLTGQADSLRNTFFQKLDDASNKLDTANKTFETIRTDSLFRLQRPEGRNLFTRMGELFGRERYMVSDQSYAVLVNLLCQGTCLDEKKNFIGPNKEILMKLQKLRGSPPLSKGEFTEALKVSNSEVLKPWLSIILRYTRIP